jgi:hypothetical protein
MKEINVPNMRSQNPARRGKPTPHGMVRQIPTEFKDKPILSSIRNSIGWYSSLYQYGDWKKNEAVPVPISKIIENFPKFPDLSFTEFLEYLEFISSQIIIKISTDEIRIGVQSYEMIDFFVEENKIKYGHFVFENNDDLFSIFSEKVTFLNCDFITKELYEYLLKIGYDKKDLLFIANKKRSNISKPNNVILSMQLAEKLAASEWVVDTLIKKQTKR